MSSFRAALRLPGDVWRLELAVFVNFLGTGLVLPFELIYLHNLRGFSFALTGLIGAVMSGLGIFFTPLAGVLIDRLGPRALMIGSFTSMACGYALFPTIHRPWQGFLCAALIGVGNGTFRSGETALFITYVPREHRHLAIALDKPYRIIKVHQTPERFTCSTDSVILSWILTLRILYCRS